MELLQLTYFCEAAEWENFSRVAEKHNVPTSNISQTVKRLEAELSVELFSRTANRVRLSDKGRVFYEGVKAALDSIEAAKRQLSDMGGEVSGELRLLIRTNRRIATVAIEKYKRLYPGVSIVIHHNVLGRYSDYDFIISDTRDSIPGFASWGLFREKIMLATVKGSELESRGEITLPELSGERFIAMSDNSRLSAITREICKDAGFIPNVVISTDDPYYVRKYVEIGMGVALVPSISWKGQLADNIVLMSIGKYERETALYFPKDKPFTKAERLFADIITETFREISE